MKQFLRRYFVILLAVVNLLVHIYENNHSLMNWVRVIVLFGCGIYMAMNVDKLKDG